LNEGRAVLWLSALGAVAALWAFSRTRRGQAAQVAALDQLGEIEVTARRLPAMVSDASPVVTLTEPADALATLIADLRDGKAITASIS
jgi:hypothetical protein